MNNSLPVAFRHRHPSSCGGWQGWILTETDPRTKLDGSEYEALYAAPTPAQPAPVVGDVVLVPRELLTQAVGWTGIASRWNLSEDTLAKLEILHHDLNRELLAARPGGEVSCEWAYDDSCDSWDTACGRKWTFISDGPVDNGIVWCFGCGKHVAHPAQAGGES